MASGDQNFENLSCNLLGILDLTQYADLHVVNEQSDPLRIANLVERLGYADSMGGFHMCSK
jgi:hypothetical protein